MVDAYFDFVAQEGAAFRLIFESDLANDPEVRKRLDQVDLTCAQAMADIIRGGDLDGPGRGRPRRGRPRRPGADVGPALAGPRGAQIPRRRPRD